MRPRPWGWEAGLLWPGPMGKCQSAHRLWEKSEGGTEVGGDGGGASWLLKNESAKEGTRIRVGEAWGLWVRGPFGGQVVPPLLLFGRALTYMCPPPPHRLSGLDPPLASPS